MIKNPLIKYNHTDVIYVRRIGNGSFGIVYEGTLKEKKIAIKVPNKRLVDDILSELTCYAKLKHPNVVYFYGVLEQDESSINLIFEFLVGDARKFVREKDRSIEEILGISHDISLGMDYIHDLDILHFGLAARNVLVNSKNRAKISDFGLSRLVEQETQHYEVTDSSAIRWMPKEGNNWHFNKHSDVWSFGITLWEIWNKAKVPYGNMKNEEVRNAIGAGKNPMSFEIPKGMPQKIRQLLMDIFVEEEMRPSFANIEIILNNIKKAQIVPKLESRSPYYESDEIIRDEIKLGQGSFGIVYKGNLAVGNAEIALKLLIKRNEAVIREFSEEHKTEIGVLLEARHKNIVKFLGVVMKKIDYYENGSPFLCPFLIFEYIPNGNARTYVKERETTEELLLEISKGIVCGMAYLHENNILHRDLAARNILIDSNHRAKISDFGLSRIRDETHSHYTIKDTTLIPNYRWIPSECMQIGGEFSKRSDIWSFGVTLWEIWNKGKTPYGDMENEQVKQAILEGQNPMSIEIPPGIDQNIKQILDAIFVEEKERPTFEEIKKFLNDEDDEDYEDDEVDKEEEKDDNDDSTIGIREDCCFICFFLPFFFCFVLFCAIFLKTIII